MTEIVIDQQLDATGLACPLPLLKTKQALFGLQVGQVLEVTTTDAGSLRDFKAYAELSDHELISTKESEQSYIFLWRRG